MTSFNPNYFIHAANVLLLVAYSVRDILWLRLFAVAASLISLPYFVLQPTPQWPPIAWSVVFAGINSFQSWRLYLERRPVKLTPDEEEVRRLAFAQLPSRKVLQLASLGSWTTAAAGERLIEHGTPVAAIALVLRGKVRVSKDERVLGELGAGDIVGSALALSGAPAEVDAVTVEPVRALRWEVATLRRYLEADPETRIVFQRHLTLDLAGKLRRLGDRDGFRDRDVGDERLVKHRAAAADETRPGSDVPGVVSGRDGQWAGSRAVSGQREEGRRGSASITDWSAASAGRTIPTCRSVRRCRHRGRSGRAPGRRP